jgi:hypothetical protein
MSCILQAIISSAMLCAFLTSVQTQQQYNYHVLGAVLDEHAKEMAKITVCVIPAERPINGRIPCDKTDRSGAFSFTVRDVADKYQVCASTTESPFVIVGDNDPKHRVRCSGVLRFPAKDETIRVLLQFKSN